MFGANIFYGQNIVQLFSFHVIQTVLRVDGWYITKHTIGILLNIF